MKKNFTLVLICLTLIARADYWTQKANFGAGTRAWNCSFTIGNKGYLESGESAGPTNDLWEYDPSTNVWTQKANFGGAVRDGAVGFSIGNKGYIGTGNYPDFWEWDQSTNMWTQKADYGGNPVWGAVGFSIGDKGYIGTGFSINPMNDFWEWDQATNTWSQKSSMPGSARWLAVGFAIGNKGYIGTGSDGASVGSNLLSDFWEWNQSTDTWTQKAGIPVARAEAAGFAINTYGYIISGSINWGVHDTSDLWQYNTANNTWLQVTDFGGGYRELVTALSIGCKGYYGCGLVNDGNFHDDFWEYTPDSYVCATGINEIPAAGLLFSTDPNPAKDFIVISSKFTEKEEIKITITNLESKIVYAKQMTFNGHYTVDIHNFSNGIYFITIDNGKEKAVRKFLKE